MRRIVIWIASTVTVVVLAFGYHTSTSPDAATAGAPSSSSASSSGTSSSPAASGPPSSSGSSSGSSTTKRSSGSSGSSSTKTYTGTAASTRYGPVQVRLTVSDGTISKVDVPQFPSSNPRDVQIADRAMPVLVHETISAQSAKIDMVSGATYTSDGYITSLQSALDQAGI